MMIQRTVAFARHDASGLISCVSDALQSFGISDVLDKEMVLVSAERSPLLVGGGTD